MNESAIHISSVKREQLLNTMNSYFNSISYKVGKGIYF